MGRTVSMLTTFCVLLLFAANISLADSNTITGCVSKKDGSLRVVSSTTPCKSNESSISWNITGPQGPAGFTGPTGPAGPAGVNGHTILSGNIGPLSGVGSNGDFFINTATNMIYGPKTNGAWGSGVTLSSGVDGMSRVVMGTIMGDGAIWSGAGFQVIKDTSVLGTYHIQFTTPFTTAPECLCAINSLYFTPGNQYGATELTYCRMPIDSDGWFNEGSATVSIRDSNDIPMDALFTFICAEH